MGRKTRNNRANDPVGEGKSPSSGKLQPAAAEPLARPNFPRPWLAGLLLVLCGAAAWSNSLDGPFVLDDFGDIENNPAIREAWPIWRPVAREVDGRWRVHPRPVVVLSFAANYALGGLSTRGFHAVNLAIHLLAGLTLFGIVRRALLLPRQRRYAASATWLALGVALFWLLHPLQTQAVTYIVQRYESLMGLFYLATLYAALRSATSSGPSVWGWGAASVTACLLAMGCKEVAVSAPLMVLLFDRAFIAGSFREALRRRWPLHAALAATWLVFVPFFLCFSGGAGLMSGQAGWAGFKEDKPWRLYALNQPDVILHYLRLAVWPRGQCLDYAWVATPDLSRLWPALSIIAALLIVTAGLTIWRPRCGFAGAWFFLILAPSSSVIPINDLAFEHRMYLPLAAVAAVAVFGSFELQARWRPAALPAATPQWLGLVGVIALTLGTLTFLRNRVYADALMLWSDVVEKRPDNGRAHGNLGLLFAQRGQPQLAVEQFQETQRLMPFLGADAKLQQDWGSCLLQLGQGRLAVPHYLLSITGDPGDADAHLNLARLLVSLGYRAAGRFELQAALRLNPALRGGATVSGAAANGDLDNRRRALAQYVAGELGAGLKQVFEQPADKCRCEYEFGTALLAAGENEAALKHFAAAEDLGPGDALAKELARARHAALRAPIEDGPPPQDAVGDRAK